jgi:hypothetical protein
MAKFRPIWSPCLQCRAIITFNSCFTSDSEKLHKKHFSRNKLQIIFIPPIKNKVKRKPTTVKATTTTNKYFSWCYANRSTCYFFIHIQRKTFVPKARNPYRRGRLSTGYLLMKIGGSARKKRYSFCMKTAG